jgi:hypothetical protein
MSQVEEDCAKYLKVFILNLKQGYLAPHDWNDCHMAIFLEHYPKGWYELRFETSQKKRTQFLKSNKLDSKLFNKENCERVKNCMEYFPYFLEKINEN